MAGYSAATHPGLARESNEDCYGVDPAHGLWLVADGVGGHAAGDVASALVRETIISSYASASDLTQALRLSHSAVLAAIAERDPKADMGSTVVALALRGQAFQVAWVGDSRAYLWDPKAGLSRLTVDHSFVEELIAKGVLRPEDARSHPQQHVITQSIGISAERELEIGESHGSCEPGQRILLCSDGLSSELDDAEIEALMNLNTDLDTLAGILLDAALQAGGRDNVTVVVVDPTAATAGQRQSTTDDVIAAGDEPLQVAHRVSGRRLITAAIGVLIALGALLWLVSNLAMADLEPSASGQGRVEVEAFG